MTHLSRTTPAPLVREMDLEFVRRLMAGHGFRKIAKDFGVSNVTVQKAAKAVEAADLAESGEPVRVVARGYAWPGRKRVS